MEENKLNEAIAKVQTQVEQINDLGVIADIIKNNEIEFTYKEVKYRVKKPKFNQKLDANNERIRRYIVLLKDPANLVEKDLIEVYKTRGIDIADMDKQYESLENQKKDLMLKLGKGLSDNLTKEELDIFKKEIDKISNDQRDIVIKKSLLLDSSIESQINLFIYTYLAYLIVEKLVDDIWIRGWKYYDSFLNEDENLINIIVWNSTLISRDEISLL